VICCAAPHAERDAYNREELAPPPRRGARYGSNREELSASICLPLCPQTRTSLAAAGTSHLCQQATSANENTCPVIPPVVTDLVHFTAVSPQPTAYPAPRVRLSQGALRNSSDSFCCNARKHELSRQHAMAHQQLEIRFQILRLAFRLPD
jgi:hypothetical protein